MEHPGEVIYRLPPNEMVPHSVFLRSAGQTRDWGHTPLQLEECHKLTKGAGIRVAVLDTGMDFDCPDLKGQADASQDFTRSGSGVYDVQSHGTFVAGEIAAKDNGAGMLGVAPECRLIIGKVLGDNGSGSSAGIAAGIRWAVQQGANVISMSLGGPSRDSATSREIANAVSKGVYVVAAFGNEGPNMGTGGWPGMDPNVFGIAAMDINYNIADFSSRGPEVDFAAPGVNVRSVIPGGKEAVYSGTSMATPYVAGCIALYLSYLKKLGIKWPSPAELYKLMRTTAKDIDAAGFDANAGWGLVQPLAMLRLATPAPTPTPDPVPAPPPGKKMITTIIETDPETGESRVVSSKIGSNAVPLVAVFRKDVRIFSPGE